MKSKNTKFYSCKNRKTIYKKKKFPKKILLEKYIILHVRLKYFYKVKTIFLLI